MTASGRPYWFLPGAKAVSAMPAPAKIPAMIVRMNEYLMPILLLKLMVTPVGATSFQPEDLTLPRNTAQAIIDTITAQTSILRRNVRFDAHEQSHPYVMTLPFMPRRRPKDIMPESTTQIRAIMRPITQKTMQT